ncbi:MAG: hypothetical protein PHV34_10520 [Verrucomicrobiae bacterium]|nr:hypothetical protein [Verrucomicrobiae bacterium]
MGADAYILSCGAIDGMIGAVNGCRVTLDIRSHWEWIQRNTHSLAVRWWMHHWLWENDPDFLIVRGQKTSTDLYPNRFWCTPHLPDQYGIWGKRMTISEAQFWATTVLMSGGALILGDRIKTLTQKGLGMLKTVFENHNSQAAVPIDLFKKDYPELWLRKGKSASLLGILNWTSKRKHYRVDLAELGFKTNINTVHELWQNRRMGARKNIFECLVNPHGASLFKIIGE